LASDAEVDSFTADCSFGAVDCSAGAGVVGVCDWAIAPEMTTPLTAVVIRSVLSMFDLLRVMATFNSGGAIASTAAMPGRNAMGLTK
jgi:hypothetical protein